MIIYKEFEPREILAEFIKCFRVLERAYGAETPCENILPDSYIERFRVRADEPSALPVRTSL